LASIWLIRRFIDARANIRYAPIARPGEIAFDMDEADFSHVGHLCTFETMARAFMLEDPALQHRAEIIHEIDLADGRYPHVEPAGIDAILQGWLLMDLTDAELESRGYNLF
jgi:hypothetical protein